jgi:type I restriction enzyme M protein
MLDNETKRRIDSARDILVGKVPDPKSQVEQITIALIYKFMDDMDMESVEMGGKPTFFIGEYQKYAWHKLFDARLSGHESFFLYSEALSKLPLHTGKNFPQLFRDIFKNAYLPYRDPETLRLFLKTINGFIYDHSERLGDAFEYLLSVLGSQGDAGQFRTPRHVIDFMVEVMQPEKTETICDPACGTAGFLISSYKHILKTNKKKAPGDLLTPDEKKALIKNIKGYDISPDMVRLSLVNLYLHNFTNPQIVEYDTLSSEDRWNETFDIIMANPPFMSPKGGIKPHKRFGVQSNRSEVLFVDYIAEHINPATGRAAIIVPEGIIFQSATAYKALRKILVENCLYAVASLPAGVFNPYSGVKTSILFLNKRIAKKTDKMLFIKIQSDGYDLGAQRREIDKNDLPDALNIIKEWQRAPEKEVQTFMAQTVTKEKIAATADFNLSGDRYKDSQLTNNFEFPIVTVGELCELMTGGTPQSSKKEYYQNGTIKWLVSGDIHRGVILDCDGRITEEGMKNSNAKLLPLDSVLIALNGQGKTRGKVALLQTEATCNQSLVSINPIDKTKLLSEFLYYFLKERYSFIRNITGNDERSGLNMSIIRQLQIPLPPISVQQRIVSEIGSYQRIIDGARQVIENYKPNIPIHPAWPIAALGQISDNFDSQRKPVTKSDRKDGKYPYYGASGIVDYVDEFIFEGDYLLVSEDGANLLSRSTPIAFSITGKTWVNNHAHILKFKENVTQKFVEYYLNSIDLSNYVTGSAQPKLNQKNLNEIPIPIPDIKDQQYIIHELEMERLLVQGNKQLIERMEQKSKETISQVWNQ